MNPIKPSQDLVPLSEFRAHVSEVVKQTQRSGRPVIITQHGRGAAVLLSAEQYEKLLEDLEIMKGVVRGQADVIAGRTTPHEEVMAELEEIVAEAGKKKGKKVRSRRKPKRKGKDAA